MNHYGAIHLQHKAALLYAAARGSFDRTDMALACQLQARAANVSRRAREARAPEVNPMEESA